MIFTTFLKTLPCIVNVGLLLGLVIFLYIIWGIELFAYVKFQDFVNEDTNFQSVALSFFTLLRMSTGEGWNYILDDMKRKLQPNNVCFEISDYDGF